jgi:hypothetical protein
MDTRERWDVKTTREKIEVMEAFERGEPIQSQRRCSGDWLTYASGDEPPWDWMSRDYRVKPPEPGEIYVNKYPGGWIVAHPSSRKARDVAGPTATRIAVKFREVIDEED